MNQSIFEIQSIIKEIENNNNLIETLSKGNDSMDKMMIKQFRRQKRNLYKELASKLIQSNFHISDYEQLYARIMDYLKEEEKQVSLPSEMKEGFQLAERLLRA